MTYTLGGDSLAVAWFLEWDWLWARTLIWGVGLVFLELHLWPCFILNNTTIHDCFQTWRPEHSIWRLEVTSQVVLVMNESGVSHTKVEQPVLQWHVFYNGGAGALDLLFRRWVCGPTLSL